MGSLVHVVDEECGHVLQRVETLCSGDLVHTPHGVARVGSVVLMRCPDAVHPICHVGGLRAHPTQTVCFGGVWDSVVRHSPPVVQTCKGFVGLMLEDGGDAVLIDGVACRTVPLPAHSARLRNVRLRFGTETCVIRAN